MFAVRVQEFTSISDQIRIENDFHVFIFTCDKTVTQDNISKLLNFLKNSSFVEKNYKHSDYLNLIFKSSVEVFSNIKPVLILK